MSQEALAQWSVMERAYETDLSVLQWVEELEQRVLMADLQIRVGAGLGAAVASAGRCSAVASAGRPP